MQFQVLVKIGLINPAIRIICGGFFYHLSFWERSQVAFWWLFDIAFGYTISL